MKLPAHILIPTIFMGSLMLMGMAGLPFMLFEETEPSPHFVAGLRLSLVGFLALMVGAIANLKAPQKRKLTSADIKGWVYFAGLTVVGINGSLTYAIIFLDDRMAMAIMLAAIGLIFIIYQPVNPIAWLSAIFAAIGVFLIYFCTPDREAINLIGVFAAIVGGTAQGLMYFRKLRLMPENIDPGIALGSAFLLGGITILLVAIYISPNSLAHTDSPSLLAGTFCSAAMTVIGWLILVYYTEVMSDSQKFAAASLEPVGAAITQFFRNGTPVIGESIGVIFLVASVYISVFLTRNTEQ